MARLLTREEMENIRNQVFDNHHWDIDDMDEVEIEILQKITEATMEKE